jgi:hypothetical protein
MSTTIRAEISKNGKWYISKHRYYELKHFCLQYDEWRGEISCLTALSSPSGDISTGGSFTGDRTGNTAVKRASMRSRMEMVEQAAIAADPDIYSYILTCVTQGVSYDKLVAAGIPCSRDYFYERYRKFFWILDQIREKM